MALLLTACNDRRIYSHYEQTAVSGWEKNDALEFSVSPLEAPGKHSLMLGLRITDAFPFRNLHMVVRQEVLPSHKVITDTITCHVVDKQGSMLGNGVVVYQYNLPVRKAFYMHGDSLHIVVRHDMKREILPGISDVGIIISREP